MLDALILRELMSGPRRFTDPRMQLPSIGPKVLTERLVGMHSSGILCHGTLSEPALTHVYRPTPWCQAVETILQEVGRWAAASSLHDLTLPMSEASL